MKMAHALPRSVIEPVREVRNFLRYIPYRGSVRFCPICERSLKRFGSYSYARDMQCMYCGALDRHRFAWLFFNNKTDLFDQREKQVLHVAPEPFFERLLKRRLGNAYLTADLFDPRAMVKMDITDIRYPDETFDVIYCSHVLEHVSDDKQAMREFCRVLKPTGWAVLLVPITAEKTFEDQSITDPAERLRVFGQEDHVRRYGPDYVDRLREAGFNVKVVGPIDFLQPEEMSRMGITNEERIYYCTKS